MIVARRILPLIVVSQFLCTSLWFAGNAIINDLVANFQIQPEAIGQLTSSVQFGFIIGTLLFAVMTVTDRYSPVKVFFISALLGACFNLSMIWSENTLFTLSLFRFLTGFCLAGIYPVGMKIASDYYVAGLGKSLGFLVGALVLGTALPHLLNGTSLNLDWQWVVMTTSGLALLGGLLMLIGVPNGPHRKGIIQIDLSAFFRVFRQAEFRSAAFGYFGHMWELYAFWAFVPVILLWYQELYNIEGVNISLFSFFIIGVGSLGCIISGLMSHYFGSKTVAQGALLISGICCLISPILLDQSNFAVVVLFLVIWGVSVVADSPLFSTLVAQHAPAEQKGTALTIVNCFGFTLTIVSIQLTTWLLSSFDPHYIFICLATGPLFGIISLNRQRIK